jgi:hypothetical protein
MSPLTIKAYLWHVKEFTRYFGKAPELLGEEEVRQYLHYLYTSNQAPGGSRQDAAPTI